MACKCFLCSFDSGYLLYFKGFKLSSGMFRQLKDIWYVNHSLYTPKIILLKDMSTCYTAKIHRPINKQNGPWLPGAQVLLDMKILCSFF